MTTFDKREDGFEKKFAHDEELQFKASARRNKMLGLWAAEKLGLSGADAEAYGKDVVMADFEEPGDHDVFRKIRRGFRRQEGRRERFRAPSHHGRSDGQGRRANQGERLT